MTAVLLHILHLLTFKEPSTMTRLPPPFKYHMTALNVHVSGPACLDFYLTRKGPPRGIRRYLIKSQCFLENDYDSPTGTRYPFKTMKLDYTIRGANSIQFDFVMRRPTNTEAAAMAKGSATWNFSHPDDSVTMIVSGGLEAYK